MKNGRNIFTLLILPREQAAEIYMKIFKYKIKFFIVTLFCVLFSPAFAQTPASPARLAKAMAERAGGNQGDLRLTTSPLPINLKTAPGSSVSAQLKVKNDGTKTENIKVSLMKFKADSQTGTPMLLDREPGDEFFNWVSFSENTFTLPANEWKTITAAFNVPETASFGYYYAIVFSRADEQIKKEERQTIITGGTATLVLLEVQVPNAKREIQITEFSADKKMYEFLPAAFTVKLRNTGNVHVAPRGNIFINKGSKTDVAILEVNPAQGSILPDSPRAFEEKWADGFPVYQAKTENGNTVLDDKGNQITELQWDFKDASKLRFGKYTAKLLLAYDDGKRDIPIEGEVSFWVVPWRIIGGALIIAILALLGLKSTLQNLWARIRKLFKKD